MEAPDGDLIGALVLHNTSTVQASCCAARAIGILDRLQERRSLRNESANGGAGQVASSGS
jgi:hypothetical protein